MNNVIDKGSTQKHKFALPFPYNYIKKFVATYTDSKGNTIIKKETDIGKDVYIEEDSITINLSQEDTNLFSFGEIFFQLKCLTTDGNAIYSQIIKFIVRHVINNEVIE